MKVTSFRSKGIIVLTCSELYTIYNTAQVERTYSIYFDPRSKPDY